MEENILYSIIVPVYGVEKYLRKCIESLLGQTYKNIEIILIDDGSKDQSPEICDEYALRDKRIKVIHKLNGGVVSARKVGAESASGDYIFCVDGDDWVSLNYVEKFNEVIIKYRPEMVCCDFIQSNGTKEIPCHFAIDDGYYDQQLIEKIIYPIAIEDEKGRIFPQQLWAKAIQKDLFAQEQLAENNEIKIGEDGVVVKSILVQCASIYVMHDTLYYYCYNDESATKSKVAYDWNGPRYLLQYLQERIDIKKYDFEKQIARRITRELYIVVFSQFNRRERYRDIKKDIIKNLSSKEYKQLLHSCKYKGLKNKLEVFLLKHHLIFPIFLLHKFRIK